MKSNETVWLDLEETIIESFDNNLNFINIQKISKFIKSFKNPDIGIFSFAIWSDQDKAFFIKQILPNINELLNIEVNLNLIPTKQEIFLKIKQKRQKSFSFEDFHDFWNKEQAFIEFIRISEFPNRIFHILIDDTVENSLHTFPNANLQIEITNINTL